MPQDVKTISQPPGEALLTQLKKTFNTFINPFAYDPSQYYSVSGFTNPKGVLSGQTLSEREKLLDVVGRTGGLAVGWAALALAIQQATRRQRTVQRRADVVSQLSSRRPVLALSPRTTAREEQRYEEIGVPTDSLDKSAETAAAVRALSNIEVPEQPVRASLPDILNPLNPLKRYREESRGGERVAAPMLAATLLTPLAVLYAGWRLGENRSDATEAQQAQQKKMAAKARLDRLTAAEMARTRGKEAAEKTGFFQEVAHPVDWASSKGTSDLSSWFAKQPSPVSEPSALLHDPKGMYETYVKGLWWVWALGSLAGAYAVSRKVFDRMDPARARMSELKRLARRRTLSEGAPTFALAGQETGPDLPRTAPRLPVSVETKALPEYQPEPVDPYQSVEMPEERLPIRLE